MLAQEEVIEDINPLGLQQVMADHVNGKSTLTPIATVYAEMDESGEVNLFHGIPLARSLYNGLHSKLFMVCSSVSDEVES